MYLITYPGERHEDHIPLTIVESMRQAMAWCREHAIKHNDIVRSQRIVTDKWAEKTGVWAINVYADDIEIGYLVLYIECAGQLFPST